MVVAGIGIVVNTVTALLFMRGRDTDPNIRGAFLHMAADALVSTGVVVVAGGLAPWFGWTWLDPIVSLVVAAVIVAGSRSLFKRSVLLGVRRLAATSRRCREIAWHNRRMPWNIPERPERRSGRAGDLWAVSRSAPDD